MDQLTAALLRVLPFALLILVIWLRIRQGKLQRASLDLHAPKSWIRHFICIDGFIFFVLLVEFSLYKTGLLEVSKWSGELLPSVIKIAGAVILAPIAEELLFRGVLLNKFIDWNMGKHGAVFLQAFLFVAAHAFAYENTLVSNIGIAQTFTDAVLFAYARFYTKSIYTPITMHALGNLVAILERFVL